MHTPIWLARVGLLLASTSLSLTAVVPAVAQPAPPQGADVASADSGGSDVAGDQGTDPPALAGRLAAFTGSVSFHNAGETNWAPATANYPVTNGEAFWTEPQAQASLEVADDRLVLDASTELDVGALDQSQITVTTPQGALFFQLNSLPQGQTVTFNTPRGAVQITAPGTYEIVAGDTSNATMVSVVDGAAHVTANNLDLQVGPQQTATIGGTDTLEGSVGALQQDSFLAAQLRGPARPHFAAAVPRQVQYMTGAADLQTYGSFTQTQQYGQVWYPREVARDWAPYRDGHWSYVQPWGWTWVDNARWGFAPFHYGRWVQVDDRWGWVAGENEAVAEGSPYPVYSPALVSFVGIAGVSIGFSAGLAPAWVPLGPREPYYPWYHCRADYFGRLNRPYGVPQTIIERGPTYINNVNVRNVYVNQRFATAVPAADFVRGQGVGRFARPVPEAAFAQARPFVGRLPVRPTAETPNLAPAAARRFDVALPARPVGRVAAGPRIERAAVESGRAAAPVLRRAAAPPGIRAVPAAQAVQAAREAGPAGRHIGTPVQGQVPGHPGETGQPGRQTPGAPNQQRGPGGLPTLRGPGARPGENVPARPGENVPVRPGEHVPARPGENVPARPGENVPARGEAAGRQPGVPAERGQAGLPALRGEGARPGGEVERPGIGRPGAERPATERPGVERPGTGTPAQLRGEPGTRAAPATPQRGVTEPGRGAAERAPDGAASRSERTEAARPQSRTGAPVPRAEPRAERPGTERPAVPERTQPARQEAARPGEAARPAPRPETPRPEAARPAPHAEAPRPATRPEAPRPAPRPEPPRAAPRAEAPRPAPAPRAEAPRPAPRAEAPRPAPAPHAEAPRPAPRAEPPRPAPHPAPHPEKKPEQH